MIVAIDGVESADLSQSGWQFGSAGETVRLRLADRRECTFTLAAYF